MVLLLSGTEDHGKTGFAVPHYLGRDRYDSNALTGGVRIGF
jgi:hypothetical protein